VDAVAQPVVVASRTVAPPTARRRSGGLGGRLLLLLVAVVAFAVSVARDCDMRRTGVPAWDRFFVDVAAVPPFPLENDFAFVDAVQLPFALNLTSPQRVGDLFRRCSPHTWPAVVMNRFQLKCTNAALVDVAWARWAASLGAVPSLMLTPPGSLGLEFDSLEAAALLVRLPGASSQCTVRSHDKAVIFDGPLAPWNALRLPEGASLRCASGVPSVLTLLLGPVVRVTRRQLLGEFVARVANVAAHARDHALLDLQARAQTCGLGAADIADALRTHVVPAAANASLTDPWFAGAVGAHPARDIVHDALPRLRAELRAAPCIVQAALDTLEGPLAATVLRVAVNALVDVPKRKAAEAALQPGMTVPALPFELDAGDDADVLAYLTRAYAAQGALAR